MKPEAGKVQVCRFRRLVETRENPLEPGDLGWRQPARVPLLVEKLEALVAKPDDHSTECNLSPITWQACSVASLFRPDGWPE